jgi:NAD-reducing hydrogenase large subunit
LKPSTCASSGRRSSSIIGGRRIHPNFAVPGGVNKALSQGERDQILGGVDEAISTSSQVWQLMKAWAAANQEDIAKFAVFSSGYFGMVTPQRPRAV